ncbi:uncharacterized protein, partial [Bemisia tabaci]|uniref:uncharacterized protein n=1 Tax=Bemisia tabaci TaxID=7038 RepID=UPI003B286CF1
MGNDPDCNSGEMLSIVIYGVVAFFSLVLTVLVLACYASRQMKEAADLNNMSWRVRPEEVLLEVSRQFSSRLALQKTTEIFEPALRERLHCRRRSDDSTSSLLPSQVYTTVGIYK